MIYKTLRVATLMVKIEVCYQWDDCTIDDLKDEVIASITENSEGYSIGDISAIVHMDKPYDPSEGEF